MPELPDVELYVEALKAHVGGHRLDCVRVLSPFVLRTVEPPIEAVYGKAVADVSRLGKRIVLMLEDDLYLVLHLMIAGRLRWRVGEAPAAGVRHRDAERERARAFSQARWGRGPGARRNVGPGEHKRKPSSGPGISPKLILAAFEFPDGTLFFTEASSKKRASMQVVRGRSAVDALDPGGLEPLEATLDQFRAALARENHTLKRALTDPHLLSGIGNAYSDEILHAARLSPLKLTQSLAQDEVTRLYDATRATLLVWIDRLRKEAGGKFPEKVTAFREKMAVHGRFRQPCPVCSTPVQRIVYAENECNYCAKCQTGGRLLADRSLSRLLKDDWPRSIDDL